MHSLDAIRDGFVELLKTHDETKCIKYIDKYDGFYNMTLSDSSISILQYVCIYNLPRVARKLIDKNANVTYQNICGYTAIMYAASHDTTVAYIIDNCNDVSTRATVDTYDPMSEMMYLCGFDQSDNIIKMIERGYDVYYETPEKLSLLKIAIHHKDKLIIKKLIDIDTDFATKFIANYKIYTGIDAEREFYLTIVKYINNKYTDYRDMIVSVMNDESPDNMLYQSFSRTYAVELADIIRDFIILQVVL
ncbi:MAG: hypothetical protein Faunusvirus56_2 [Faunusvirus sp.]|jgi:hypothetical protein|uniref:Uncharacterized protein n=1 Tax=Faunusvirus sp. TaxID=2487766 RepID=A0A3G5A2V6_9VIRU|nr:MAG: hypothetical protein Faunusvirus56_2 [Faunusvirus sp.]